MDNYEESMKRVGANYKHYKDGWLLSVTQQGEETIVSAVNINRGIGFRIGAEIQKKLHLFKSECEAGPIAARYRYETTEGILLFLYLIVIRFLLPLIYIWSLSVIPFDNSIPLLGRLIAICVFTIFVVLSNKWANKRIQLEKERYSIIQEVLAKNNITFKLEKNSRLHRRNVKR